jgi:hypothetical protein
MLANALSAGHLKIPAAPPEYGAKREYVVRNSVFVLAFRGLPVPKSNQPTTHPRFVADKSEAPVAPSRLPGSFCWLSSAYMIQAKPSCLALFTQTILCAFVLAFAKAGNNNPARMAMMAITTNNSISVKADK